jgi:hypothetical protein
MSEPVGFFFLHEITMATIHYQYIYPRKTHCLKKKFKMSSLIIKGHAYSQQNSQFVSIKVDPV